MRTPRSASAMALTAPTLPNPCTMAVVSVGCICSRSMARPTRCATPRPVASRRPSVPPALTGLPVTISVTVLPWYMEYVSMNQAITCSLVPMSGAITSVCEPTNGIISCM